MACLLFVWLIRSSFIFLFFERFLFSISFSISLSFTSKRCSGARPATGHRWPVIYFKMCRVAPIWTGKILRRNYCIGQSGNHRFGFRSMQTSSWSHLNCWIFILKYWNASYCGVPSYPSTSYCNAEHWTRSALIWRHTDQWSARSAICWRISRTTILRFGLEREYERVQEYLVLSFFESSI